ncbi:MFS transporter [Paraburkholderia graminis]|uniref:MFS transporter n=1 Tax=Paraburkholderia graminis TaxID=60548 RepID=UPI002794E708|nr:MFS transporter [Paraburkholderia graminis]MDQ0625991.1 putative MFS family arabinose efflux permease [Paraburkholderia graminis]
MSDVDRAACDVTSDAAGSGRSQRLPVAGLLVLATCGFITILTEALPAGLLTQMSDDLGVSEALIGQFVTTYAIGSLLAAIPLAIVTRHWRRRPLLLLSIVCFVVVNTITAVSTRYPVILAARFVAGVSAGVIWALLAGYAARMAPPHLRGRAIAIAMVGTPLALSIGIPVGTWLGASLGWRMTFGALSALALALTVGVRGIVPDFAGQSSSESGGAMATLRRPGLKSVLAATFLYVLAHNLLYTYIAPFVALSGGANRVDAVLLVFGLTALVGIGVVGLTIDSRLRQLLIASTLLFASGALLMGVAADQSVAVFAGVAVWGLAFGGVATVFQTASAEAAGELADIAQSLIVTVWNLAIAGGGVLGAMTITSIGPGALPWSAAGLLAMTFSVVIWTWPRRPCVIKGALESARQGAECRSPGMGSGHNR